MNNAHSLVLGTVQLGMPYGIANGTGQPNLATAEKIIATAFDAGIGEYDTAQAYGTSEAVLGTVFKTLGVSNRVKVISKLHPDARLDTREDIVRVLEGYLEQSLIRLGINRLHGLMLHREDLLDHWNQGLGDALMELTRQGWVDNIGVSVYTPDKAGLSLGLNGIDMVQLPSNILDRRFEKAGIFKKAAALGKTIYVRSIFLQGLFFKPLSWFRSTMPCALPVMENVHSLAKEWGISIQEMGIGFTKTAYPHARILFGAETPDQVKINVSAWHRCFPGEWCNEIQNTFHHISEDILNLSCWPK